MCKKDRQVKQLFALLGSMGVKAALKNIDEIDPKVKNTISSRKQQYRISRQKSLAWRKRRNFVHKKKKLGNFKEKKKVLFLSFLLQKIQTFFFLRSHAFL